ncbi:hypothetical protein KIPB_005651 [Kipferlia bialata]|uniref:Uncharacterized protein n=1 Tax=Kipferlia bialata TaxID=797122 RepID=A0A9K3CXQ9_9EUKA|nr:hypothetical protein KIPB_005651 [Kipferlia bialata]|eukprot:g5651.t1
MPAFALRTSTKVYAGLMVGMAVVGTGMMVAERKMAAATLELERQREERERNTTWVDRISDKIRRKLP